MGQRGWHERGYLPHYDGYAISQHVVFRLADSVPPGLIEGDDVLDRHIGRCVLRDEACAAIVAEALLFHDVERYLLQAWCVMPNHVHVLLATNAQYDLGKIVGSWKRYTANRINKERRRTGGLWAKDYFDRYIRDEAHFQRTKSYIEMNPVCAGLCDRPEAWQFSSSGWNAGS